MRGSYSTVGARKLLWWALLNLAVVFCHTTPNPDIRNEPTGTRHTHHPTPSLFTELEQLSRIVDISYCVGVTGVHKPFLCASRCTDFPDFELVKTWETGPLLSDSCGYVAVDHGSEAGNSGRIIVAFRGTYSIANTIADLSTLPQPYTPYPGEEDGKQQSESARTWKQWVEGGSGQWSIGKRGVSPQNVKCDNCSVHLGFMTSWRHTRPQIVPDLEGLIERYPNYQLTLVGHSLGGAVAALASLEFHARGWDPQVTTFGEPRIGNANLCQYIDKIFPRDPQTNISDSYRRVTHTDDPVPLLPLSEWGYQMHGGEIFISKPDLSPDIEDLVMCHGDSDPVCIGGAQSAPDLAQMVEADDLLRAQGLKEWYDKGKDWLSVPPRYRIWQLFFAHRDYFWRLGLCIPPSKHAVPGADRPAVPEEEFAEELR